MIPARSRKGGRKIRGDLMSLSLAEILQTLQLGMKTGRVTLTSGVERGHIWIENGAIRDAAAGSESGEAALFRMLAWDRGEFVIDTGCRTNSVTVHNSTEYLLLEGMRLLDEAEQNEKKAVPPAPRHPFRTPRARILAFAATLLIVTALVAIVFWPEPAPSAVVPHGGGMMIGDIPPPSPVEPPSPANGSLQDVARSVRHRATPAVAEPVLPSPYGEMYLVDPLGEAASRMVLGKSNTIPASHTGTSRVAGFSFPPPLLYSPEIEFATLEFVGKSHVNGSLSLLVNEEEACSLAVQGGSTHVSRLFGRSAMKFTDSTTVPPGSHRILARLEVPEENAVYEKTLDIDLESGATGRIRVVLKKSSNRRIALKYESR